MTPQDPRARLEQVELLYRNAPPGIAAGVLIAAFAYWILREADPLHAQAWLAASLLVSAARALLVARYRSARAAADANAWFCRNAIGVFAAGATWGVLGLWFFPQAGAEVQIGLALILAGMTAGAIAVFAVSAAVFAAFMVPALLPLIATLALMDRPLFPLVALMGLVFIAASLAVARNIARALNEAIVLRLEHEDARRRIAAGELHLRMLAENVPAFIAHFDGGERLRHCNTAYAALFGAQPGALLGRGARDIVGPARYDAQAAAARRALDGESQHYRTTRLGPRGDELVLDVHRAPFRDSAGAIDGYYVFATDVTAEVRAQLALARAERELRLLLDNTPAMICYVDRDYRYRLVNRAYAELYGKTTVGLLGEDYRSVLSADMVARAGPYFERALRGEPVRYERRDALAGREARDLVVQYVPDFGDDGQVAGAFTLLTDITELKRVDRLKSEFVSTVSHELRTPLTSIRGSLGLIADGAAQAPDGETGELIAVARRNCERLTRLIDDLLDIDKIEAGRMQFEMKPADLMALVDEAVEQNASYAAERSVELRTTERVGRARVVVDPLRFGQLMANLLSNAAKYSPAGAAVEVSVRARDDGYRVSVRDRGPGIDPAFHARIFQRFSQSDSSDTRRAGGTGLGLAIARSIVERFGGAIGFDSMPGSGSTFHFDLPASGRAALAHG